MTNLEYYKDEIKERLSNNTYISDCIYQVYVKHYGFHTRNTEGWLLDWLLEEHREPIKLKQWEYDLIETNDMPHSRMFKDFKTYKHMVKKGHFKGITDTSMTLQEILDNCEVEDNGRK